MNGRKYFFIGAVGIALSVLLVSQVQAQWVNVTISYGVKKGDSYTFEVTTVDENFVTVYASWNDGRPFMVGEKETVDVLTNPDAIVAKIDSEGHIATLDENLALYKYTYNNGSSMTVNQYTYILPTTSKLENGTTIDLGGLIIMQTGTFGNVSLKSDTITQYWALAGRSLLIVYNSHTGVAESVTYTDSSNNQAVIQLTSESHSSTNGSIPFQSPIFMASTLLLIAIVNTRKFRS